ncbi:MAG: ABC transporter substrate-binding protein [Candidatus Heimdallarchaeota archaeon]
MRKRVVLVTLFLTSLVLSVAAGSVQAQEKDPSEYQELYYDNMMTLSWDAPSADAGPPISEQLAQIGIRVIDVPTDDGIMYPALYDSPEGPDQPRRFDIYQMSHGFRAFPEHLYDRLPSWMDMDWGSNIYNLHDDVMDDLINQMNSAETNEDLHVAVDAIQIRFSEILPWIPIYLNDDVRAMREKWQDVIWDQPASSFGPFLAYKNIVSMWANDGDEEFIMAYPSDLRGTNPVDGEQTDGRSAYFKMLVYAPLLAWNKDLSPAPWLATDWKHEVVNGKSVITYTIRDNAFWHDGVPVTAEDVAFTFSYTHESGEASIWHYQKLINLESVVADGNKVIVTMNSVNAWAMLDLGLLWIIPKHIWEGEDPLGDRWDDPNDVEAHVGCGPFKFVSRVPEENFVLERWDKFWEPAKFQYFKMKVIRTASARVLAIQADEVDAERYNLDVAYVKTMQTAEGVKLTSYADMWDYVLGFNLETPGLDDYEVRRAIAYAIDREAIVNRAMLGWGTPIYSVVPEAFYPTWYNPATPKFTTGDQAEDITMANKILDDAGYIDVDGDGIREFPGVTPITTGPTTVTVTVAEFSLRAIGVVSAGIITTLIAAKRKKK